MLSITDNGGIKASELYLLYIYSSNLTLISAFVRKQMHNNFIDLFYFSCFLCCCFFALRDSFLSHHAAKFVKINSASVLIISALYFLLKSCEKHPGVFDLWLSEVQQVSVYSWGLCRWTCETSPAGFCSPWWTHCGAQFVCLACSVLVVPGPALGINSIRSRNAFLMGHHCILWALSAGQ